MNAAQNDAGRDEHPDPELREIIEVLIEVRARLDRLHQFRAAAYIDQAITALGGPPG